MARVPRNRTCQGASLLGELHPPLRNGSTSLSRRFPAFRRCSRLPQWIAPAASRGLPPQVSANSRPRRAWHRESHVADGKTSSRILRNVRRRRATGAPEATHVRAKIDPQPSPATFRVAKGRL